MGIGPEDPAQASDGSLRAWIDRPRWRERLMAGLARVSEPVLGLPCMTGRVGPENPGFSADRSRLRSELVRMARERVTLARPIVVLAGWRSPPTVANWLAWKLAGLTSGRLGDVLAISYTLHGDIERIAQLVHQQMVEAIGSGVVDGGTGGAPGSVDIVGISMGGLVARRLAAWGVDDAGVGQGRLRVARLFTLGTPHRGAELARWIRPDAASRAMRPGSRFLASLDQAMEDREWSLVCYARLNDRMVGARRTAPPGMVPLWTQGVRVFSHYATTQDRLIMVDLARRLRGEPGLGEGGNPPPRD